MKDGKVGLGILGLGSRGVYFGGRSFTATGEAYVAAVCDPLPNKVAAAKEFLGEEIHGYTDIDEFLKDEAVDAVIVASPDFAHAENALKVLGAKKNMYLEKPMAQTIEDCDRIVEAWKGTDTVFMVGLELRYCTLMRDCKRLIESGEIGKIKIGTVVDNVSVGGNYFYHDTYWRTEKYIKTLMLQKGTHSIDLANWLVDASPVRVFASAGLDYYGGDEPNDKRCHDCDKKDTCPEFLPVSDESNSDYGKIRAKIKPISDQCAYAKEIDTPDNGLLIIDYDNGARLCYMECHFTPEYTREFMFVGDKGKLTAFYDNDENFKIQVWKRGEKEPKFYYPEKVGGAHGGGDTGIIKEFLARVREGKPGMYGIRGARDSAAIAIAALESEKTGLPARIPKLDI